MTSFFTLSCSRSFIHFLTLEALITSPPNCFLGISKNSTPYSGKILLINSLYLLVKASIGSSPTNLTLIANSFAITPPNNSKSSVASNSTFGWSSLLKYPGRGSVDKMYLSLDITITIIHYRVKIFKNTINPQSKQHFLLFAFQSDTLFVQEHQMLF